MRQIKTIPFTLNSCLATQWGQDECFPILFILSFDKEFSSFLDVYSRTERTGIHPSAHQVIDWTGESDGVHGVLDGLDGCLCDNTMSEG